MRRRSLLSGLALAPSLAAPWIAPGAARAQNFAERPVTLVTGYSPGGSTDIAARLLADRMAAHLGAGTRIVVENRPGASGAVCSEWLKRQPADGFTFMVAETGSHAIAPNAITNWNRYDPVNDFTHLGIIGAPPLVLVVNNRFAANSAAEVVERLRSAPPESITYATSGVGGVLHLASEMLAQSLKTRFVHVPYRSGAQMMQSIHTGEAQFGIAALASANQMIRDGMVRGIAVTGRQRFPTYPDMPTLVEAGVPGFEFDTWFILVGPPNMPLPAASAINRALVTSLHEDALRDRLLAAGHDAWRAPNGLDEARGFMVREQEKYRAVVARTGVRLEG
ncbi:tripartite tricarboxylate transporter substrate binding protein [Siccirubricoccus sp. KC 17139]|uniref:Tripartite tricarboxylate transporter substrate binding protein n=1 Tax=Siccirubricoccus soli TaxID=2899147 RepID=A0ABT1D513_9PROT|nr:tripartite tricarboxylate transporter substrate binding protein [Siccirubricoccus soli]MCO6417021.1 tripartite tricarboxylate transporter substrate binding protein [Siccirubricoccus soli]MCP2683156.1 tripartite tricarboxylate transporter substrate binding protein [Siccirubricoccus soli]